MLECGPPSTLLGRHLVSKIKRIWRGRSKFLCSEEPDGERILVYVWDEIEGWVLQRSLFVLKEEFRNPGEW